MEVVMTTPISNPGGINKRTQPRRFINVGGVQGLLVLGGSLAIAGLMALFTIKTRKSSSPPLDNLHKITKQTYIPVVVDDDGLIHLNSEKEAGLEVVLHNHIHELQGNTDNTNLCEESISSQVLSEGVVEAAKQGEEDECQHEILVLSDDSTPPESIMSCDDDYTESTDLSLDEEDKLVGHKDQPYQDDEEEEEVDQADHLNCTEEDNSEEEEEEVTEHSSSLSNLAEIQELTAATHMKKFADIDPNYERIAKEQNSLNSLGLGQKKKFDNTWSSGMKAGMWLMVLPVVMLTMLLAMFHFFVVDNYVLDMNF